MNKNNILIGLFLSTLSLGLTAQVGKIKKASKYHGSYSYEKSLEKYSEITDKTPEMYREIAEGYFKTGNFSDAEENYAELLATDGKTADDIYNYAKVLKINKKYAASTKQMEAYQSMVASDSRAKEELSNKTYYTALQKDAGRFTIDTLSINTKQEDFGPSFYKDQVVFASSREGVKSVRRKWNWNGLPFLNVYVADKGEDAQLSNASQFKKSFNKKYHEGPAAFNADGNYMMFTRNNYAGKSSDEVVKLQLFSSAINEDEKWSKPVGVHFNSDEYSVGHATLTADGKKMYFASDMPGGKGGVDIYVVDRNEDGTWATPMNMGTKINTEGNEMFPFIHENGMLFFSSNGKAGLGGLDVFIAQIKEDKTIGKVENVGTPINTNMDDFGFILDKEMKKGYFSSNREEGKGDDDIYSFNLLKPFTFGKTIKGIAKSKKGEILADTKVSLYDASGTVIETVTTSADGAYSFSVDADKKFKLDGTKDKYFEGGNTADTHTEEDVIYADVILEKDPGLSLLAIVTDKKTSKELEGVKMTITDNLTGEVVEYTTPATGDYRRPLADKKLNDRGSYNILLEKDGYFSKTVTYNTEFLKPGIYEVHANLDLGLDPEVTDLSELVQINPINFDLNKYKIRPDAEIELNKIVEVMNKYPGMVVELGSHTDCRASKRYNEKLSDRRAKASAAYIKTQISNPERIYGKGYGEVRLLNGCACEGKKKSNCSEEEHEKNRRTEFKVMETGNDKVKVTNTSTDSFDKK